MACVYDVTEGGVNFIGASEQHFSNLSAEEQATWLPRKIPNTVDSRFNGLML